ncbi:MAG: protein-(glutamine-N5) methyltransferase, release factor-specific [Alphaproteobacteria bacterium PA4]|nr:MAG: protein-(glutamine-N5) methyltransferase, release factor-specific [Alphaproteobacteria bacterium PA4]
MNAAAALLAASRRIDRFDAEVLLAHLVGTDRLALLAGPADLAIDEAEFETLVARREAGEPVAYITGAREFWSLDLDVTPDVLIPRPDSETLVEAALAAFAAHPPATILDLGTGSGALLLACLSEFPRARGLGVDKSERALAVATGNARRLGFAERCVFRQGDWGQGLRQRFDLILSNPPYVEDSADLSSDVRDHEPGTALFAGPEGLDDYRRLVPQLPGLLNPDGVAVLEIGATQAAAVAALAMAAGFAVAVKRDLAGRDRALVLKKNPPLPAGERSDSRSEPGEGQRRLPRV